METKNNPLLLLIQNMSGMNDSKTPTGSDTISWKSYQIAKEVNDLDIVPQLLDFIKSEEYSKLKKHTYQLLLFILANTKNTPLANKLLERIKQEDNDDDSLYTILIGIWESNVKLKDYIQDVIYYIDDQRELIRNAAIRLLSSFENDQDIAEDALIEIVKYPYDNFDLRYASESLAKIGSLKCIDPLKKALEETEDQELKKSISKTIEKLKLDQL